jgi:Tfp pilus assembly protein FimT
MIVIGILAIITAIGVPAYLNWIPKYKLGSAAVNLKADLEMAKLAAKRENTCVSVFFANNNGTGEYTIFRDDGGSDEVGGCNYTREGDEIIIKYQELSPGISFDFSTNIQFVGNGEARRPGGGDIHIDLKGYAGGDSSNTSNYKFINISFLGRITLD